MPAKVIDMGLASRRRRIGFYGVACHNENTRTLFWWQDWITEPTRQIEEQAEVMLTRAKEEAKKTSSFLADLESEKPTGEPATAVNILVADLLAVCSGPEIPHPTASRLLSICLARALDTPFFVVIGGENSEGTWSAYHAIKAESLDEGAQAVDAELDELTGRAGHQGPQGEIQGSHSAVQRLTREILDEITRRWEEILKRMKKDLD